MFFYILQAVWPTITGFAWFLGMILFVGFIWGLLTPETKYLDSQGNKKTRDW